MALRVHKSELNSSKLISLLDSDIQDTDRLITELSSFVTNTKTTAHSQTASKKTPQAKPDTKSSRLAKLTFKTSQAQQPLKGPLILEHL